MSKRKAFNFYKSYFEVYLELPEKDKIKFIDALLKKQFYGVDPVELEGLSKLAYVSQKHSIDAQVKGYEDKTKVRLTPPTEPPTDGGGVPPSEQEKEEGKGKGQEKEKGVKVYAKDVHDCLEKCLTYFESQLHPKKPEVWLDVIEKLHRIDGLPFEKIVEITQRARSDEFWKQNFLSLTKLRKKNKEDIPYVVVFNERFKNQNNGQRQITAASLADTYERLKRGDI